jgi:hypothetical protein
MPLEIELSGTANSMSLSARQVFLRRSLGNPVEWRCAVDLSLELGDQATDLAGALAAGPVRATPRWKGSGGGSEALGPSGVVVHAEAVGETAASLELVALITEPQENPFVPRRRVHRVKTLRELVERLDKVAVPITALKNVFGEIAFADGADACIVQDGLSDWSFLGLVLAQINLYIDKEWLPPILLGSLDEDGGTVGRWTVTVGSKAAADCLGLIERRTLRFDGDQDNYRRVLFGSIDRGERVPGFAAGIYPEAVHRFPMRVFTSDRWKAWRKRDLPLFMPEGQEFVHAIEDRLYPLAREGDIGWETRIHVLPSDAKLAGPVSLPAVRPWVGYGSVKEYSAEGPWISLLLEGFEEDENVLRVRLTTPYSGKNGTRGQHFVPEKGTRLAVGWSGRFGDTIVALHNIREKPAEYASPSLWLEGASTWRFDEPLHVTEIAKVSVDSAVNVAVNETTRVDSDGEMFLTGDGADVKLTGSRVRTGRGS